MGLRYSCQDVTVSTDCEKRRGEASYILRNSLPAVAEALEVALGPRDAEEGLEDVLLEQKGVEPSARVRQG